MPCGTLNGEEVLITRHVLLQMASIPVSGYTVLYERLIMGGGGRNFLMCSTTNTFSLLSKKSRFFSSSYPSSPRSSAFYKFAYRRKQNSLLEASPYYSAHV